MESQLNYISALWVGAIALAIILIIAIVLFVVNFKKGILRTSLSIGIFLASLALAVFVSKPLLSLINQLFPFETVFFTFFMVKFGAYETMNATINSPTSYATAIENFKTADIAMNGTVKSFLVDVFEKTSLPAGKITTLSAIASNTFSYMLSLFIVAFVLFVVMSGILTLISSLILKRKRSNHEKRNGKLFSGFIGLVQGVIVSLVLIIIFSTFPILGLETDYLASGFEKTFVLKTPYQYVCEIERYVYRENIDFNKINQNSFGNLTEIKNGGYKNEESEEYAINISLEINGQFTETITKDGEIVSLILTGKYIYTNNMIIMFENNEITAICKYDAKDKTIEYTKNTENATISGKLTYQSI